MSTRMQAGVRPILLVEDNPEDHETVLRTFRKSGLANRVYRCEDGEEALAFLRREGEYADPARAPRPGVILLDLNLPGADGHEVIGEIKNDPNLRSIPVIVLTTSSDTRDIESCYAAGANSYVQKPLDLPGFMTAVERLGDYWFDIVLLPGDPEQAA